MRLCVTSWSFPACTLAEAAGLARVLGFSHIDVGLLHGPALDRAAVLADHAAAAAALAGLGAAAGVGFSNLYWLFGAGLADRALTDPAARPANEADFARACRFAQAAGIPSVFVLPGVLAPGATVAAALEASAESLRRLLPLAQDHGLVLTVEPHVGGLLDSPARTLDLLARVPGLRLALDYAHFACLGWPQSAVDPLAPHAGHVHMRQARPGALQAKWGQGTLDIGAQVAVLRAAGYAGFLAVEYVHQAYMNTLADDVLTETVQMRDALRAWGIG
jgi:sugar phosphate isomerase/epimerase